MNCYEIQAAAKEAPAYCPVCGEPVYERLYESPDGMQYCPDCLRDYVDDMSTEELAAALGCSVEVYI